MQKLLSSELCFCEAWEIGHIALHMVEDSRISSWEVLSALFGTSRPCGATKIVDRITWRQKLSSPSDYEDIIVMVELVSGMLSSRILSPFELGALSGSCRS